MSRAALICLRLIVPGCAANNRVDYRNFAIDTYSPTPHEIQVAEASARNYWTRNESRFGPEPRYLAVETSKVSPYDGLYSKLINSETTAISFSQADTNYRSFQLLGVMIYDTKIGHLVGTRAMFQSILLTPAVSHASVITWRGTSAPPFF